MPQVLDSIHAPSLERADIQDSRRRCLLERVAARDRKDFNDLEWWKQRADHCTLLLRLTESQRAALVLANRWADKELREAHSARDLR